MMVPESQRIAAVLSAVRYGAWTSQLVAAATGLPPNQCSAYLCDLEARGLVRHDGRFIHGARGRRSKVYQPVDRVAGR